MFMGGRRASFKPLPESCMRVTIDPIYPAPWRHAETTAFDHPGGKKMAVVPILCENGMHKRRLGEVVHGASAPLHKCTLRTEKAKESAQRGGRTHSLQIKSLTLYRLS